jgi:hypothetical protein
MGIHCVFSCMAALLAFAPVGAWAFVAQRVRREFPPTLHTSLCGLLTFAGRICACKRRLLPSRSHAIRNPCYTLVT